MRASGPGQSALLLLDVVDVLNARKIPYAIIGAFAASFHGVVRASMDADAVISLRPRQADADALLAAVQQTGLKCTYRVIGLEDFIAMKVFAGSPKDLQDVIGVLQVSSRRINRPLLNELARRYGQDTARRLQSLLREHRL